MQDWLQNIQIRIQNISLICFMYLLNATFLMFFMFFPYPPYLPVSQVGGNYQVYTAFHCPLSYRLCTLQAQTPQKNREILEYSISSHCTFNQQLSKERWNQVLQTTFFWCTTEDWWLPNNSHQFTLSCPQADISVRLKQLRLFLRVPQWDQMVFVVQLTIDTQFCLFQCSI